MILQNHKITKKFAKSLDVLFGWQLYLVGYLIGRLLRNRVSIEVVMKKLLAVYSAGRLIRLASVFCWQWVSVDRFVRLAVLFSCPWHSVGRFIRLAMLFCPTCYSVGRVIRLAVSVNRSLRLAVLFGWPFCSVGRVIR